MPPILAAAIPAIIGGGSALLQHKSANDASKRAYDSQQEQARQGYDANTRRFSAALKKYDMKRGLMKDFITQHGLTPGNSVMDYLNSPDPTAPDFAHAGGSTYRGGPATDFSGLGKSAAAGAAKLLAPKPEAPTIPGTDVGNVGPMAPPAEAVPPASGLDIESIIKNASGPSGYEEQP
jgi:hypothetical protein